MFYRHRSTTPSWLYKHPNLNLDVLPEIQKELLELFYLSKQFALTPFHGIMELSSTQVTNCPLLFQELDRLKLREKFVNLVYIGLIYNDSIPAHVDSVADVGLNIPLCNCQGTYTIWYDGKLKSQKGNDHFDESTSCIGDGVTLTEIDRVEANRPYWINVNVLHRPESTHADFRLAASLRFNPDPIDQYQQLWPNLELKSFNKNNCSMQIFIHIQDQLWRTKEISGTNYDVVAIINEIDQAKTAGELEWVNWNEPLRLDIQIVA